MTSTSMSKPRRKKPDEKRPRLLAPYRSYLHLYAEKIKSGEITVSTAIGMDADTYNKLKESVSK